MRRRSQRRSSRPPASAWKRNWTDSASGATSLHRPSNRARERTVPLGRARPPQLRRCVAARLWYATGTVTLPCLPHELPSPLPAPSGSVIGAFAAFRIDRPILEAAMHPSDDLVRKANVLADTIRRVRAEAQTNHTKGRELPSLQSQLSALWVQIRAARVENGAPSGSGDLPDVRKTYSKWR